MISGDSAAYYTDGQHAKCYLTHLGSIVAGSFLNGFFNIVAFVLQSLKSVVCGGGCDGLCLDLVRSDTYAYIYLTSVSYCEAGRCCAALVHSSRLFLQEKSILHLYRVSAYVGLVGSTLLVCWVIKSDVYGSVRTLLIIGLVAFCCVAFFIDHHPNAAEGIIVCYLMEKTLEGKVRKYGKRIEQIEGIYR